MAVKMALAVGLFIVFCVSPGLNASQVVPDGLVYTEVKRTLVQGVQGLLTCRFYGVPLAVYWRKGLDPDVLTPVVAWHDGKVSGPRFEDGSCDVDENYSLIIYNVSTADAGRMYCTVSNNKGPLMNNYTDILVVDTAITTNLQTTLQLRQATYGILQCTVHIKARRVSWKKGTTASANESLVVMESNQNVTERSGSGYDDGTYNITQDYSLVIKELQIHHEGLYVCEVTDHTGISFQNHTFVNVVAYPLEPFPTIQECLNAEQHDSKLCTLFAKSEMTLTCQAVKYYPSINLVFQYGSKVLEPSDTREWNNTDGTKNKTITIATGDNKELYTCVGYNTPGTNENQSTSVLLHCDEPGKSTLVIILVLLSALILISSAAFFIWRKKRVSHPLVLPVSYSSVLKSNPHNELEDYDVKDLTKEEWKALEQRVNSTVMKHYSNICDATKTKHSKAKKIISENVTALFDSQQLLTDWQQRHTSTYRQYLRAFQATFSEADKSNPALDHTWPTNEELKSISRHLTQESMKEICKELQIAKSYDDAKDEGKMFDGLCEWRSKAADIPFEDKFKQLSSVLKSNNLGGLLPTVKGPYIYKAELVDLAFHLLIHDLLPIAKELDINVTKLASYRPAFHPSHVDIGTIKLLVELFAPIKYPFLLFTKEEYVNRSTFCSNIKKLHSQDVARRGVFEYDMSYGELCSILDAITQRTRVSADQATSGMPAEELGNVQYVLQLTDQDKADRLDTTHPLTAYALFKIWKEKPRPSVFNYRAALAHKLRRLRMPVLVGEIIEGKYVTEHTSLAFIEDMVRGLNQDQIRSLGGLLQLSEENEQWHTTTPSNEICKQIYDWVADWTTEMEGSWRNTLLQMTPETRKRAEKHRDLNNKLVDHGFLDLAREIMIIEQQIGCKYWLDINNDDSDVNIKQ